MKTLAPARFSSLRHAAAPNRAAFRAGFTLLEVLLVLAILGVIAAMVVPNLLGRQQKAMVDTARASISGLEQAAKLYATEHGGDFPQGNQQAALTALLEPVDQNGKSMKAYLEKAPTDPWGQVLFYEFPNTKAPSSSKPAIWSAGPNRQNEEGAGDDVNNWSDTGL